MTHSFVPKLIELATAVADPLGLDVVDVVYHTNQSPPVLRVDIRSRSTDTSLENCEQMSRALDTVLDTSQLILDTYVLEVSSPGLPEQLTTDREFISFRGFPVLVRTREPYRNHQEWTGRLIGRDQACVHLNQKGRAIAIPCELVTQVQLVDSP